MNNTITTKHFTWKVNEQFRRDTTLNAEIIDSREIENDYDIEKLRIEIRKNTRKIRSTLSIIVHDSDEGDIEIDVGTIADLKRIIADVEQVLIPYLQEQQNG